MTRSNDSSWSRGTRRPARLAVGALALVLAATACVSDDPETGSTDRDRTGDSTTDLRSDDIVLTSGLLQTVDSCDALLDRLVSEGLERVGPYGFGQGGFYDVLEGEMIADDDAGDSATESTIPAQAEGIESDGEDRAFSGTNNQEVDVDEADLVKTDGDRLVMVHRNTLRVIDVTGATPRLERTVELDSETNAGELFLVGDTALVMGSGWSDAPFGSDAVGERFGDIARPIGTPISTVVDVDLRTGEIGDVVEFEGSYLSAREVEGTIRIALTSGVGRFEFLFPSNQGAEEAATEANREIIENSTIEDWLPAYRIRRGDDIVEEGPAVDCDDMHLPAEFAGFGALTVLTVTGDDGDLTLADSLSVLTEGQTVHASTDRLTVATARTPEWDWRTGEPIGDGDDFATALHTFDITDPTTTRYLASGEVRGSLLSQYSLSESDGFLRVATTDGSPWGRNQDSESFVTVLEVDGDELATVGQVGGLGKGEQIFSVRFLGDLAYVVTFRQIDPLYTVDLSEPSDPTVLGELKIPGFSNYLHPVGDGRLLGIGQDATEEGFTTGAQVSLFDVSDLRSPDRMATLDLGQDSQSTVGWDPKSFLWWAADDLAVIPVQRWFFEEETNLEGQRSSAVVVRVADDDSLTELGRIGHPTTTECEGGVVIEEDPLFDPAATGGDPDPADDAEASFVDPEPAVDSIVPPEGEWCWSYQPDIRRSVVIGDSLYTISDAGVQVNDLSSLETRAWLAFDA